MEIRQYFVQENYLRVPRYVRVECRLWRRAGLRNVLGFADRAPADTPPTLVLPGALLVVLPMHGPLRSNERTKHHGVRA